MTQSQFKYIRELSWGWYRENMKSWAIEMLRNLQNAPQWVKDCLASDCVVCPSMDEKVFELAHNEDIEKILRISQKRNFEVNYTKELTEFFEAKRNKNEYEMIDSVCDMIIVAVNAGHTLGLGKDFKWCEKYCRYNLDFTMPLYDEKALILLCNFLSNVGYDPYLCLLETIKELKSRDGKWDEDQGKWCKFVGAYSLKEAQRIVREMTNTPIKFVEEKERYWGFKFDTKSQSDYTKIVKWYKANYDECKKGGENA